MREKAKVFLCNKFPWLMPARHFTCHPSSKHLVQCLEAAGVGNLEVSYSQLPDLKAMMNRIRWDGDAATTLSKGIIDLDRDLAASMERVLPDKEMEFFFPTITIVGRKNSGQLRRG